MFLKYGEYYKNSKKGNVPKNEAKATVSLLVLTFSFEPTTTAYEIFFFKRMTLPHISHWGTSFIFEKVHGGFRLWCYYVNINGYTFVGIIIFGFVGSLVLLVILWTNQRNESFVTIMIVTITFFTVTSPNNIDFLTSGIK